MVVAYLITNKKQTFRHLNQFGLNLLYFPILFNYCTHCRMLLLICPVHMFHEFVFCAVPVPQGLLR